jgi:DNA-binding NarL/FixJ family response regulator
LDKTLQVVAEGETVAGAYDIAEKFQPDVMLLDIKLQDGSGIDAISEIKKQSLDTLVVLLTACEDEDDVLSAFSGGAHGYVIKGTGATELIRAIHTISEGETYVTPTLAAKLLRGSRAAYRNAATETTLTPREEEVLQSVGQGMTNKEIARAFALSEATVKHHMTSIMGKLSLRNRVEVALVAANRLAVQKKQSAIAHSRHH